MPINLHLVYDYTRFAEQQVTDLDTVVLLEDAVVKCHKHSNAYAVEDHLMHRGISHNRTINYDQLLELINAHGRLYHWI